MASGKDTARSTDRLAQGLTQRGVRVEFVKEGLIFTGEHPPLWRPSCCR
jgi:hypothetical protein